MSDFEYDCMLKKRLANMARYRKRGSKSKKCNLPCDHMTQKQWKERCGAIMNYNLSKPMNWATYKSMPTDLQREYISDLHEKYNVNACVLSEMFGVVAATVRLYFKENFPDITFSRGSRQTEEQRSAWEKFLHGSDEEDALAPVEEVVADEPEAFESRLVIPAPKSVPTVLTSYSLCFEGTIDPMMIANSIRNMVGDEAVGKIQIVCEISR